MTLTRLAWRELRNTPRFSLFFIFNLVLGLSGYLALDAFKTSVQASLLERSREILSADLSVSANRPLSAEEHRAIDSTLGAWHQKTTTYEMFSMVASTTTSRLCEIVAIESGYPFYGTVTLQARGAIQSASEKILLQEPVAWVPADLAAQLRIERGSRIRVGQRELIVDDLVLSDTSGSRRGFALASRIYIGQSSLQGMGLIEKGSRVQYRHFYRLPQSTPTRPLAQSLNRLLKDPAIQVTSHEDASENVARLQGFLNDFLGLAALSGLFLSGLAGAYLFWGFLSARLKSVAILRSFGLPPAQALWIFVVQLTGLGAVGAIVAVAGVSILLPVLLPLLETFIPYSITSRITAGGFLTAFVVGVGGSLLSCLPMLIRLRSLSVASLFQEQTTLDLSGHWRESALATLPAFLFYWVLAVMQAKSYVVGSLFIALFLGSGILLGAIAWVALHRLPRWGRGASLDWRLALRQLSGSKLASGSSFLALGLGVLLITLVPQLQRGLMEEVRQPSSSELPSLFLFDIQPEQEKPLREFLAARGTPLQYASPMVHSRLLAINQKPFEKETANSGLETREEERESRFRNRGVRLTTRAEISPSEKIVEGRPFGKNVGDPAEVSIEKRFARRLGIRLGDVLSFDVQGVPVEGKVVNLRSVSWTSFQPNFFIQFQPGVLEGAPHTVLASVPALGENPRRALQDALVSLFPTISIIDISQVVERFLRIFDQMGWAIRWMALLSLITGFVVLFSIAQQEAHQRRHEVNLLKVLGASVPQVRRLFWREYGLLAFCASTLGTLLSLGMTYLLAVFLFESQWVLDLTLPLLIIVTSTVAAIVIVDRACVRVLGQSPAALLQSGSP